MGNFSWCTSDTRKSIPCVYASYENAPSTVYLLNPFGEPYKETDYEGYGVFGGRDAYELVAEWNREFLSSENLRKPERAQYAADKEGSRLYHRAKEKYKLQCEGIKAYASGASDDFMRTIYGEVFAWKGCESDWKRCLGIAIACYDEEHVKLRYPIKLVERACEYEAAGISPSCPFQGCFYDESLSSMRQRIAREFDNLEKSVCQYADEKADSLDDFFASQKMDNIFVAETYPHLIVKDDDGNCWKDGDIYDFVLNECLAFESDGTLQFGFGATSQELADKLKAHANSHGIKPVLPEPSIDKKILDAAAMKNNSEHSLPVLKNEREI